MNLEQLRRVLSDEVLGVLATLADLDAEQLATLEGEIVTAVEQRLEGEPDDEALELAEAVVAAALEPVRTERANRERRPARAAELRDRLKPADLQRPSRYAPRVRHAASTGTLVASANGERLDAMRLPEMFRDTVRRVQQDSGRRRYDIARVEVAYPEARTLGVDAALNAERIRAVVGIDAITAAGGLCAPTEVRYEVPTISSDVRPLRDALPKFGAERGGIRFVPPMQLADLAGAVQVTTEAQDAASVTKPCLTIVCNTEEEVTVSAVSRCIQVGEFAARFGPEHFRHAISMSMSQQAREAEDALWTSMRAASTAGENLSATRDILATLARASAQYRSRHRIEDARRLRWAAPSWLVRLMQADLARQLPGDNQMGVALVKITGYIRSLDIEPVWSLDADQAFGAQAAGGLLPWPTDVETILWAEGAFIFLDGGTLDIGVVRDSTLISQNNLQVFAETFENVAMVGVEALALTLDICPSGISAGQDDSFAPCVIGS